MSTAPPDKKILIVDDDAEICTMLTFLLEDEGYHIRTAPNGEHALDQLRQGLHPCIVLLDLNMPIMTGWEFREVQRNDPALAGIPVAVISADRSLAAPDPTLAALDYLPKPIDLERLLNLLDDVCA